MATSATANFRSFTICQENELQNGQLKECEVEGSKLLLVRENDQYYALGAKCTHYGAPLSKGAYCNGIVRCPWHGACFNVKTGDIEDFPGFDGLPTFQVQVDKGQVSVTLDPASLNAKISAASLCNFALNSKAQPIVIIGGGGSASSCIESLRRNGSTDPITMISSENCLPYDRPKLSKALGIDSDSILLKKADYYESLGVQIIKAARVVKLNVDQKTVTFSDGRQISYSRLVIASGAEPRKLTAPGTERAQNIFYLRNPGDGQKIAEKVVGQRVVIVGSSFIGMELASLVIKKQPASVTVISASRVPFEQVFGAEIGLAVQKLFESNDVKFKLSSNIKRFLTDSDGQLTGIELENDAETLATDICLVGIGVQPSTEFLKESGVKLDSRGFVGVDQNLMTNVKDVYAVGDVAVFPLATFDNQIVNIQHWQMALKHGKFVGEIINGKKSKLHTVPFFWTVLFGKSIRYTGYNVGYDELIIHGDLTEFKFVAYFLKGKQLVAVATCGKDPVAAQIAEYFRIGRVVSKEDIVKNSDDLWPTDLLAVK